MARITTYLSAEHLPEKSDLHRDSSGADPIQTPFQKIGDGAYNAHCIYIPANGGDAGDTGAGGVWAAWTDDGSSDNV